MKANCPKQAKNLIDIPNIGPSTARDLNLIGITNPMDLKDQDAIKLYSIIDLMI